MNRQRYYYYHFKSGLILVGLLSFLSCSLNRDFRPTPIENQSVHPHGNHSALVSIMGSTGVGAYLHFNENNDLALHLIYSNRSGRPLLLLPKNIAMIGQSKSGRSQKLKIYSAKEYIQQLQSELAVAQIEATMEGALESPTSQENSFMLRYSKNELHHITNPGTDFENSQMQSRLKPGDSFVNNQNIQGIQQPLLTERTLYPNQFAEGDVMIEHKSATSYNVTVPFGGESHIFHFSRN